MSISSERGGGIYNGDRRHFPTITELEEKVQPVIQSMSSRGLNIDIPRLDQLIQETSQAKGLLEEKLKGIFSANADVNFNSSRDIANLLDGKFGVKLQKTKSGRYRSDRRTLKNVNNPIVDEITVYREYERLLSSLKAINVATDKARGKIFCEYINTCPSGRLYAKSYNVQGIPELARSIVYAEPGNTFLLADYETFELRILSALSHDVYFKDCWSRGLDLHRKVVSDMQKIPYESVTEKQRKLGKALSFGLSYGQEPAGLARNLHISTQQAQKLMESYKRQIPEIERFKTESVATARAKGYVETYYGRKRFLSGIKSPKASERGKAERQAINTIIQGTGADIVKFALVNLHSKGFKIDLMLHDGILITVPDDQLEKAKDQVKEIMEIKLEGMRLPVSIKTGKRWSDCYEQK